MDLGLPHVLALSHLLSMGAAGRFVDITTSDLGRAISRSQQAASKHLRELAEAGLVERAAGARGHAVRVTEAGLRETEKLHSALGAGLGGARRAARGALVSGMGEGAYYMSLPGYTEQFRERIGYVPFPGTLNVRMEPGGRSVIPDSGGVAIDGFSDGRRTYGPVRCLPARANGMGAHVIRPERTHHDGSIIELISRVELRRAGGLSDGSRVLVELI